ncbi:MAG: NAD(P)-dependent oxidoreductase [Muribaculaceae bacterium]|nr:NAD(P)-dependent oxidoreductase [Muribaculaceae bacterium]
MKRVLVVGAGGFAGGFICEECLRRGWDTWAGVRATTSRRYLTDPRLKFAVLDFENPASLGSDLKKALGESPEAPERWDYIIYNLGATKCVNYVDFNRINYLYLREFTEALKEAGLVPDKMVYISSLSAMGKGDEKGYAPFTEKMVPIPDTRYGASKLKAEMWLATAGIPTVIFRATGIYGPRDRDYFLMFKSIARGADFSLGFRRQLLSFLYVEDLARACCDALEKAPAGRTYIVGEPAVYTQKEFRGLVAGALGKKLVVPVRLPLAVVRMVSAIAEKIGVARGKPSTLNSDKYRIMAQRNWNIDISRAREEFGFDPRVSLAEGVRRSVEWYRKEGWL